ncbi:MAG: chorismate synthase [Candidatus Cloacimonetes bacterium]|nr:chorismate synthase [Candidatus Cloacimonadota bacterium]MDD4156097.1 chorismate synthase [Candidatus Cloacimonadota bacterium]
MRANSMERYLGFTFFGESHGPALGIVIDDVLPGVDFPFDDLKKALDKRKPGTNFISSSRKEKDDFEVLSGLFDGKTTGMPICIIFKNKDYSSKDYENLKNVFRPGHSDYSWYKKFKIYDYRGGGRASGRETISRVAAGAYVKKILGDIEVKIYPIKIGTVNVNFVDFEYMKNNVLLWPDCTNYDQLLLYLNDIKKKGDSIGGMVEVIINNIPIGLGDPVLEKLDANLAKSLLSIGGVKGIEFGSGFDLAKMCGSESNDQMELVNNKVSFKSNHCGGILGGVSTGNQITFRLSIKAVPSIAQPQKTINYYDEECELSITGRHDVCLIPRIIPVIESMVSLTLVDAIAHQKLISSEELTINDYREAIDKIDEDILIALHRRNQISKAIGNYKKTNHLPIYDEIREKEVLDKLIQKAEIYELSKDLVDSIWNFILKESKKLQ